MVETSETFGTIVLYFKYPISDVIFKQQIGKAYVKVSIKKDLKLLHVLISPFSYKSLEKH